MRALSALLIAVMLGCVPTYASSYEDFSRGVDANNRGDADTAIAAFSRSLAAGDLAPAYVPSAFLGRARAELARGQCDHAADDLSRALALRRDFADAYRLRGRAMNCLGHPDAALRDLDAAVALAPSADNFFDRARLQWDRGDFQRASADSSAAAEHQPANPYFLLWVAMTASRIQRFDREGFAGRARAFSSGAWPEPLLAVFAGHMAPEDAFRNAAAGGGRPAANRKCEADFYVGEWRLAQGLSAKDMIAAAATECPRDYIAYQAANSELRRLERTQVASLR